MNISKFTQKSLQAVQNLEKIAYEYGNQEIEQEHLLYALLNQEDSLILKLIEKMEINKEYFINKVKMALDARVKVSGGELRFGQYLNKSLVSAEDEARAMGDEYVSVEHLFLSLLKYPSPSMSKIWNEFGITRERFLQALSTVRGNQRVVSDNPEATYETRSLILLSAVTGKSGILSVFFPVKQKTIPFLSVSLVLVRLRQSKALPSVL